jgi:thioredoxin 1
MRMPVREEKAGLPKSFSELVETSDKPVLVDFWAEWCGPCRMVSPAIARVARAYSGRLLTVKVNVDEKRAVAERYQIQAIPTIMLFHKGRTLMRLQGAQPYENILRSIEDAWPRESTL